MFDKWSGEWHWVMGSQVAQAFKSLGWVESDSVLLTEEIPAVAGPVLEGRRYRVLVIAYERDSEARRLCIAAHGTACCGFRVGAAYGGVAEGFAHVHHIRPLSEVDEVRSVDPAADSL